MGFIRSEGPPPSAPGGYGDDYYGGAGYGDDYSGYVGDAYGGGGGDEWEATAYEEDVELGWTPSGFPPNEEVFITDVKESSWAWNQLLEVDDQLLKVNGVDVATMDKKS